MQATGIDLLVPGLLGPMQGLGALDAPPRVPHIERMLSRADITEIIPEDFATTLFHLFGLEQSQSRDLPTAPFCRLADGGSVDDSYWLHLSPVHLQLEGDALLLFDVACLDLSKDEAQQLIAMLQDNFSDRGWHLESYAAQRWYLRLETPPDLQTFPLIDVTGRNIDGFLPAGGDASDWQAKMTEVQMLLHMDRVNVLREGRGQLPVNGVWPHGGGRLLPIEQTMYASVVADKALVRGMALAAGVAPEYLPQDSFEPILNQGRQLMVYDLLERSILNADPYGWIEAVENFNSWFRPLLDAVRSKRLDYINIYPCNGWRCRVNAGVLRRFWRRSRPLRDFVTASV